MRALLLDGPVWVLDHVPGALAWLWRAYWILIAAGAILCVTTASLWLVLALLGVPVPVPPPVPLPVAPTAGRAGTWTRVRVNVPCPTDLL